MSLRNDEVKNRMINKRRLLIYYVKFPLNSLINKPSIEFTFFMERESFEIIMQLKAVARI